MRIEIKSKEVLEEEIKPKADGTGKRFTPFIKRWQVAYAQLMDSSGRPDPYPSKFKVTLQKDHPGFEPGAYVVADGSFWVDRNGNLTLGRLQLQPDGAAAVKRVA